MQKLLKSFIIVTAVVLMLVSCYPSLNQNIVIPKESASGTPVPTGDTDLGTSSMKKITIGISMQGLSAPYVQAVADNMEKLLAGMTKDVDAIILDGQENAEKQLSHVENFISRRMDAIILNPISFDGCVPAVEAAVKAGIPIITLITRVRNQDKCAAFVGSNHYESGVIEATMLAKALNGKGDIVVLEGVIGIDSQLERWKGYQDTLAKYPEIKIVAFQTASWIRNEAYSLVQNWIENGKHFDAVLSENDNMAMGAVKAINEAGLTGKIMVFGIDGDPDALMAVSDGRLNGTVFQDARAQAQQAVECAIKLAKKQSVNKEYVIPFKEVTKDNAQEYIDRLKQD